LHSPRCNALLLEVAPGMSIIVKLLCTLRRRRPPEHDRVPAAPAHVPSSSVLLGMGQSSVLMVIQLVATTAHIAKPTWTFPRALPQTPERR
jgi:hypothetical protein